jgi:hypothetical protein
MPKNFLAGTNKTPTLPASVNATQQKTPVRKPVRILIISVPEGVIGTIHNLHALGFADVNQWSPLLPAQNPGEVMSILTRYVIVNS